MEKITNERIVLIGMIMIAFVVTIYLSDIIDAMMGSYRVELKPKMFVIVLIGSIAFIGCGLNWLKMRDNRRHGIDRDSLKRLYVEARPFVSFEETIAFLLLILCGFSALEMVNFAVQEGYNMDADLMAVVLFAILLYGYASWRFGRSWLKHREERIVYVLRSGSNAGNYQRD